MGGSSPWTAVWETQFVEVVWPEIVGTSLATEFRLDVDEVGVLGPASSELP